MQRRKKKQRNKSLEDLSFKSPKEEESSSVPEQVAGTSFIVFIFRVTESFMLEEPKGFVGSMFDIETTLMNTVGKFQSFYLISWFIPWKTKTSHPIPIFVVLSNSLHFVDPKAFTPILVVPFKDIKEVVVDIQSECVVSLELHDSETIYLLSHGKSLLKKFVTSFENQLELYKVVTITLE